MLCFAAQAARQVTNLKAEPAHLAGQCSSPTFRPHLTLDPTNCKLPFPSSNDLQRFHLLVPFLAGAQCGRMCSVTCLYHLRPGDSRGQCKLLLAGLQGIER